MKWVLPGAMVTLFAPEQHDLYDGRFVISANRIYMVGGLTVATSAAAASRRGVL